MKRSRQQLSSSSMSTNNHICNDIIVQILSWLPVDSLLRFKSVCKCWLSLITNPKFVKLHNDHYHHYYSLTTGATQIHNNPTIMFMSETHYSLKSMDKLVSSSSSSSSSSTVLEKLEMVYPFDSTKYLFKIVGSCNGLICISMLQAAYVRDRKEILCLWNPSTKEFKQLPSHEDIDDAPFEFPRTRKRRRRSESKIATFGFGYDHVMEDYKVIASVQWFSEMDDEYHDVMNDSDEDDGDDSDEDDGDDMYHYELKVYTLGTDTWRRIQGTPYENENEGFKMTSWSFVNGAFHRIAQLYKYDVAILSFDIVEEVYGEVPKLDCFYNKDVLELAVLRGCLCLCSWESLYGKQGLTTEVWMMMNYGVKESWTKLFSITNDVDSHLFKPVWLCRNGGLLMEVGHSKLVIYDPSKQNEAKLLLKYRSNVIFKSEIYIASLVSLKSQKERTDLFARDRYA